MKMAAKKSVIEIEDDDDDDDETFFSLAVAAEADALTSKRRRITQPSGPIAVAAVPNPISDSHVNDGLYTAALKGNHSLGLPRAAGNEHVAGGGGGSCFKCGKPGHWARDCDSGGGGGKFGSFGSGPVGPSVAEKSCPCGSGICLVLTANTEKNPGRKFYKCPLRQENGGCGFFEWCDSASGANSMAGGSRRSDSSSLPAPGLDFPIGQQFYRCPSNQGSSCGFFKSCNENTQSPGLPVTASKAYGNSTDTYNTNYTTRTSSSSCFKCGKEGHWARDCSAPSSNPPPQLGGGSASCYKCGKPGHWSRDCTFT